MHTVIIEQAFEITMTPALYRHTIHVYTCIAVQLLLIQLFSPHALNTCYQVSVVQRYRAGVIVISKIYSVLLLCAYILNLVSGLLLPSLYLHFLRIFNLLVHSLFCYCVCNNASLRARMCTKSRKSAYVHMHTKSRQVRNLELMCACIEF